jgi:hypothetical protein
MAKQYFLPNTEDGKAAAFEQFRDNIAPYVATFGLAAGDITQQGADADYYRQALNLAQTMSSAAQQWTAWKGIVLTGISGSEPALPAKPAGFPTAVAAGILSRFLALAKTVKNHKNYTPAIGEILGLEGAEQTAPDLATIQPDITAKIAGNRVEIPWGWGGNGAFLDMIELQVDRDEKGFVLLAYDTTPGYVDTEPFPATPTKWTYRAIYRVGDAQVGQWSKEESVTVGG